MYSLVFLNVTSPLVAMIPMTAVECEEQSWRTSYNSGRTIKGFDDGYDVYNYHDCMIAGRMQSILEIMRIACTTPSNRT